MFSSINRISAGSEKSMGTPLTSQTTFTNNQFAGATSVLLSLDPSSDDFCRPDLSVVSGGINGTAYRGGVDPNAGSANWLRSMWVSWDDN